MANELTTMQSGPWSSVEDYLREPTRRMYQQNTWWSIWSAVNYTLDKPQAISNQIYCYCSLKLNY